MLIEAKQKWQTIRKLHIFIAADVIIKTNFKNSLMRLIKKTIYS